MGNMPRNGLVLHGGLSVIQSHPPIFRLMSSAPHPWRSNAQPCDGSRFGLPRGPYCGASLGVHVDIHIHASAMPTCITR